MPEKNRLARERKREMKRVVWSGLIVLCALMSTGPAFAETAV